MDRRDAPAGGADNLDLLELAEAASDLTRSDRGEHAAALLARTDEVVAAAERLTRTDPATALRLCAALSLFWQDAGRVDEGRRLTERAISAVPAEPSATLAAAHLAASELAFRQGDQDAARDLANRAIEIGGAAGNARAVGLAHVNLARVAYRNGDAAEIDRFSRAALDAAADDRFVRRSALHMLAWAAHTAGDIDLARTRFEDSLAFRAELGDRFGVAVEASNLADLDVEAGNVAAGAQRLADALDVAREIGSQYLVLNLLPSIATAALARGKAEAAGRLIGATDAMSAATGLIPDPGVLELAVERATAALGDRLDGLRREGAALEAGFAVDFAARTARAVAGEAS